MGEAGVAVRLAVGALVGQAKWLWMMLAVVWSTAEESGELGSLVGLGELELDVMLLAFLQRELLCPEREQLVHFIGSRQSATR